MDKQQTPLAAAKAWAKAHPDLEAILYVKRYGENRTIRTVYYAVNGKVSPDGDVCQVCGHVHLKEMSRFVGEYPTWALVCEACRAAGLTEAVYTYDAPYTVRIDLRQTLPTTVVDVRPAVMPAQGAR